MPNDNPIVTKYKVVDWRGEEVVINIATRKEADHLEEYHTKRRGAPCRVVAYKDYKYIGVRRVSDEELGAETE